MSKTALIDFDFTAPQARQAAAAIWSAACGEDLAFSPDFIFSNTRPTRGVAQAGKLAQIQDQTVGFIVASAIVDDPTIKMGWIDVMAVAPLAQRHGAGSDLLSWAEGWLAEHGCTLARMGGSLRPFAPGIPAEVDHEAFFIRRGFERRSGWDIEWDVARSLRGYQSVVTTPPPGAHLAPMQPGQENDLLGFMQAEFPGRWLFEVEMFLADGGRASDYLLLWVNGEVGGFCRATLEGSERSLERFYMHRLPRPWGQLGPLGISASLRGGGLGAYLIDASAQHLQSLGIDGCVIDWTGLVDLYAKFGFQPYRQYITLTKLLT